MRILLISLFVAFAFSNCNDSSTNSSPTTQNSGTFEVTINSELWKGVNSTFNNTYTNDKVSGEQLIIKGTGTDGRGLIISVNGVALKNYQFDLANSVTDCVISLSIPGKPTPVPSKASVTITAHNAATKAISGTFTFETDNQEFAGTNGSFTGMVYKVQ